MGYVTEADSGGKHMKNEGMSTMKAACRAVNRNHLVPRNTVMVFLKESGKDVAQMNEIYQNPADGPHQITRCRNNRPVWQFKNKVNVGQCVRNNGEGDHDYEADGEGEWSDGKPCICPLANNENDYHL